jgi:hypothetical protein
MRTSRYAEASLALYQATTSSTCGVCLLVKDVKRATPRTTGKYGSIFGKPRLDFANYMVALMTWLSFIIKDVPNL